MSLRSRARPRRRPRSLRVRGRGAGPAARCAPVRRRDVPGRARVGREDARRGPPEPGLARAGDGESSGSRSRPTSRRRPTSRSARCRTGRAPSWLRRLLEAGLQGDRPRRRLPAARIGLSGLVRVRASRGRLAGQGRLRPAGAVRRPAPRRAARREPGLLPDAGDPRPRAAAVRRPGGARPDPRRRQDRALGRRTDRERGGARTPRRRRAFVRTACRDISTRPRWSAASSSRPGSRRASMFVPHLVPAVRGVVTTAYAPLAPGATTEALTACLVDAYAGRPFVRVLAPGEMVDSKRTRGSNVVELQAVRGRAHGHGGRDRRARQPGEGRRGSGDPEPQPRCSAWTRPWGSRRWRCTRERDVPAGVPGGRHERGAQAVRPPRPRAARRRSRHDRRRPVHDEPRRRRARPPERARASRPVTAGP